MEGPVGERYGAQGEVVLAGRSEEAEHVPDGRNQDDHQPECRARVIDGWERGGTIAA